MYVYKIQTSSFAEPYNFRISISICHIQKSGENWEHPGHYFHVQLYCSTSLSGWTCQIFQVPTLSTFLAAICSDIMWSHRKIYKDVIWGFHGVCYLMAKTCCTSHPVIRNRQVTSGSVLKFSTSSNESRGWMKLASNTSPTYILEGILLTQDILIESLKKRL